MTTRKEFEAMLPVCGMDCWNRQFVLACLFAAPSVYAVRGIRVGSGLWCEATVLTHWPKTGARYAWRVRLDSFGTVTYERGSVRPACNATARLYRADGLHRESAVPA